MSPRWKDHEPIPSARGKVMQTHHITLQEIASSFSLSPVFLPLSMALSVNLMMTWAPEESSYA